MKKRKKARIVSTQRRFRFRYFQTSSQSAPSAHGEHGGWMSGWLCELCNAIGILCERDYTNKVKNDNPVTLC